MTWCDLVALRNDYTSLEAPFELFSLTHQVLLFLQRLSLLGAGVAPLAIA